MALNFYDRDGPFINHHLVECQASAAGSSLCTGCFCNLGMGEVAHSLSADELSACFVRYSERLTPDVFRGCLDDNSTGSVRVSLGLVTTFADVYRSRILDSELPLTADHRPFPQEAAHGGSNARHLLASS